MITVTQVRGNGADRTSKLACSEFTHDSGKGVVMVQMNRRCFLGQAAMSTFPAGLAINGVFPPAAEAQFTTFLSYLLSDNPILAVVDLIELGTKGSTPTTADVVARLDGVTQAMKNNFEDLQAKFRYMLVEAFNQFALKQDTLNLAALSYRLNIATAGGEAGSELTGLRGDIDQVAFRLGSYGVAGSLTYINAIALQNLVHTITLSPPQVILQVNKVHEERIGHIIYDGKQPDSLESAIVKKRGEIASGPFYKNYQVLQAGIGDWYRLGVVTRYYEAGGAYSNTEIRYTYDGFKGGQPAGDRSYGPETFGSNVSNAYSGRLIKATYTPRGTNEAYTVFVRPDGSLVFPQSWPCGQALVNQVRDITDQYTKLYNSNYGLDITTSTSLEVGMTPEHAALRAYLIRNGLDSVKRILAVANRQLA